MSRSASPVFIEPLRRDSSIGTLSRDASIDSAVYQSPQEDAAYCDRHVDVGRPKLDRHRVKYSRKLQRKQRVTLTKIDVPEDYEAYMRTKKRAAELANKKPGSEIDDKKQSAFRHFEKLRARVLEEHRDNIVSQIEQLRKYDTAPFPTTISPTPLDPMVQERFVASEEKFDITFHGTSRTNYDSIFHKGLCVPLTNGVTVKNGSAHGVGIYSSTAASYASGYSNVTALLVCAHCSGTGKSVGNVRVSFSAAHVTPIAVVSWGEETAEQITNYTQWGIKCYPKYFKQPQPEDETDEPLFNFNIFYEGLRQYLETNQRQLRWAKRVDRRKQGKEFERARRSEWFLSRLNE